jgi:hypothetical protein
VAGCASGSNAIHNTVGATTTGWTRDSGLDVSVSHPADWHVSYFDEASSFSTALLFLANRPLRSPCTTSRRSGISITCRSLPRAHLDRGGVVIGWFSKGFPEPAGYDLLAHTAGRRTRIDGYPAKISTAASTDSCEADGGTTQMTAVIVTGPGADNVAMTACLAHPTQQLTDQVRTSLRSVRARNGAVARGVVTGQYRIVGGPAPGLPRPVQGTIWAYPGRLTIAELKTAKPIAQINTDAAGRYQIALAPGEYTLFAALGVSRSVQRRGCGTPTTITVHPSGNTRSAMVCSVP